MRSVSYKVRTHNGKFTFETVDYEVAIAYGRIEETVYTDVDLRTNVQKEKARERAEKIMRIFSKNS